MEFRAVCSIVIFILCSRIVTWSEASDVKFKSCSDGKRGLATKLNIEPCLDEPCRFHLGTNVTIKITMAPREIVKRGKLVVIALFGPKTKYFPFLKYPDVCEHHGVECPLKEAVEYTIEIDLELKEWYPTSPACVAQFGLLDQTGEIVFCIKFPVVILP